MPTARSIDGIKPPLTPRLNRRGAAFPEPQAVQATIHQETHSKKKLFPKQRFISLRFAGIVLACGIIGTTAFIYQPVTELAILAYGVWSYIKRIPSQTTFLLAIITLACIPITDALGHYNQSGAFSSYSFLLLLVATICLIHELRAQN